MPVRTIDGIKHYYRLEGWEDRPLLVLIHSVGFDHAMWDQQVGALTRHFRVLRHDMRGHGGTEVAREVSVARLGQDVLALVDAIGGGRFACCGISLGGMVALWLGANAIGRIDRIVACNAPVRFPTPPAGWDARFATIRADGAATTGEGMMRRFFSEHFRANSPFYGTVRATIMSINPEGMVGGFTALRDADLEHQVGSITAPTLILTDEQGAEWGGALANKLANGQHMSLSGGHIPSVETPQAFNDAVVDFLLATR